MPRSSSAPKKKRPGQVVPLMSVATIISAGAVELLRMKERADRLAALKVEVKTLEAEVDDETAAYIAHLEAGTLIPPPDAMGVAVMAFERRNVKWREQYVGVTSEAAAVAITANTPPTTYKHLLLDGAPATVKGASVKVYR